MRLKLPTLASGPSFQRCDNPNPETPLLCLYTCHFAALLYTRNRRTLDKGHGLIEVYTEVDSTDSDNIAAVSFLNHHMSLKDNEVPFSS